MKDKSKQALLIARAKRTALGRFLCRLAGDNAGAVMMEYVVLGVMVVAAAVAMVLLFGKELRAGFDKMIKSTDGRPADAAAVTDVTDTEIGTAHSQGTTISSSTSSN